MYFSHSRFIGAIGEMIAWSYDNNLMTESDVLIAEFGHRAGETTRCLMNQIGDLNNQHA
jgi:hypothetical protein